MERRELESAPESGIDTPALRPKTRLLQDAGELRNGRRRSIKERRDVQILDLRKRAFTYTVVSSSAMLVVILIITLLQGFRLWDFDLPKEILYALLVATIGKVAESLFIVMKFLFGSGPPSE